MKEILDRNKLAKMRWMNPCATLQDMSEHFGVSRERIRQVLNDMELPTRHYSEKKMVSCLKCGTPFIEKEGKEFCGLKCKNEYNTISVTCSQCGKLMEKKACQTLLTESRIKLGYKGNFFCSKICQGYWLAEKHGYGVGGEVTLNCFFCNKEFHMSMGVYGRRAKRGQDLFCSIDCLRQHRKLKKNSEEGVCGFCGKTFKSFDLKRRMNESKSGKIFCSVYCCNQCKRVDR